LTDDVEDVEDARVPPFAGCASVIDGGWKENGDSYEGPDGEVGSAS